MLLKLLILLTLTTISCAAPPTPSEVSLAWCERTCANAGGMASLWFKEQSVQCKCVGSHE